MAECLQLLFLSKLVTTLITIYRSSIYHAVSISFPKTILHAVTQPATYGVIKWQNKILFIYYKTALEAYFLKFLRIIFKIINIKDTQRTLFL